MVRGGVRNVWVWVCVWDWARFRHFQVRYFQTAAHRLDGCVAVRTAWTVFNEQPVAGESDVWRKTAEEAQTRWGCGATEGEEEEEEEKHSEG